MKILTHKYGTSTLQKNRDDEEKLMKDVPGWEVGTYYGVPLYHDVENRYPHVPYKEYYAHCRPYAAEAEMRHREWFVA